MFCVDSFIYCSVLLLLMGSSDAGLWKKIDQIGDKVWRTVKDTLPDAINPLNLIYTNSCIADLGCFYTGPPFFHPLHRPLPLSPTTKIDEIKFLLFTPTNKDTYLLLEPNLTSLENSTFDPSLGTKVIIHGFMVDMDYEDIRYSMKDAILGHGDYNVIIVDWSSLNGLPYSQAVANTRVVGAQLAKLVNFLINHTEASPESFHIIGHSLGGQTAGYAGERIPNLGRITGLDPAGPYFHDAEPEVRLDITDALFVDVIHTDGGEFVLTGLGTSQSIGHMDFYPNGGHLQPGCVPTSSRNNFIGAAFNFTTQYVGSACDHSRANDLFLETINNTACKFLSIQCDSYSNYESDLCQNSTVAEMGFHNKLIYVTPAKFYLKTNVGRYPCDICGKVYRQAGTRNRHKNHHFNVSFKCWLCPSEFSRKYTLQNHVRGIHGTSI